MGVTPRPSPTDPALRQARRKWRTLLVVGIVLCAGPILGLLATPIGMALSLRQIEEMKAPTPDDLAQGPRLAMLAAVLGLVAGAVGLALVCLSYAKLQRLRREASPGPWR